MAKTRVTNGGKSAADGDQKIYIGRSSAFGNEFRIGIDGDRDEVIRKFRIEFLKNEALKAKVLAELKGKTLVCHCKPLACHGDVYVEFCDGVKAEQKGLF